MLPQPVLFRILKLNHGVHVPPSKLSKKVNL